MEGGLTGESGGRKEPDGGVLLRGHRLRKEGPECEEKKGKKASLGLTVRLSPGVFVCPDTEPLNLLTLSIVRGPAEHAQLRIQ